MLRLLNIEFQKLRYSKSAKVLSIAYFLILPFIALLISIKIPLGGVTIDFSEFGIFEFPIIWHINTYMVHWLKLFLAIVIVSMVTMEYSNRTLKQNLIDGLSKKEYILSKFYTVLIYAFLSTFVVMTLTLILGLIHSHDTTFGILTNGLEFVFAYFLKLVAFFSFCLFLGILVKRSAFALGFLFIWWVLEWILYSLLRFKIFPDTELYYSISQFFPLLGMSNLIEWPIPRINNVKTFANNMNADIGIDYALHWYEVLIVLVWIFLFIYGSFALLKKRDL